MGKIRDERRFADLVGATAAAVGLNPVLVEKDYWAVEALRSVRAGFEIELKGAVFGSSRSSRVVRACRKPSG